MTTTTILENASGFSDFFILFTIDHSVTSFMGGVGKVIMEWVFKLVSWLPMFYQNAKWFGLQTAVAVGQPMLEEGFTFAFVIIISYCIIHFLTGAGRKGQTVLTILGILAAVSIVGYYVFGWGR